MKVELDVTGFSESNRTFFIEMLPYVSTHIEKINKDGEKVFAYISDEKYAREVLEKSETLKGMIVGGKLGGKEIPIKTLVDFTSNDVINSDPVFEKLIEHRKPTAKEAMYAAMVDPLIEDIRTWTRKHTEKKYNLIEKRKDKSDLFGESFIDMIREVILPRRDEFKLLMTCSSGTRYENFLHEFVQENQKEFLEAIGILKENGYPVTLVDEEELHMLLSAYLTACFEPIIHGVDEAKLDKYLNTIQEFFMPGWLKIMGIN